MMKKNFLVPMLAAIALVSCFGSMSANAATVCDNYSCFSWSRSGKTGAISLKCTTSGSHFSLVDMIAYDKDGNRLGTADNNTVLTNGEIVSKSETFSGAVASIGFTGVMYWFSNPEGPPMSSYARSVSG